MPAKSVDGNVKYPNLPGLISFNYVVSHSASPGTIVVRTQVGRTIPDGLGDMEVTDGFRTFKLYDCRIDYFVADKQLGSGTEWEIRFSDERWRWGYSVIHGWYNQLDPNGKLIPSTVQSPYELAVLCLKAMGVKKYTVDMPPGITSDDAKNEPDFLVSGANFPQIGLNPPCDWYGENAAAALSGLCDQCGRRLVFDPITRTVHISRAGVGADLPPGSIAMQQLSITAPETPDAVEILGSPTRYQPMLPLQAVGRDWDGQIKPIKYLSYAPLGDATKQSTAVTVTSVQPDGIGNLPALRFRVNYPPPGNPEGAAQLTQVIEYQVIANNTTLDAATSLGIDATAKLGADFVVTVAQSKVTLAFQREGKFDVLISDPSNLTQELVVAADLRERSWDYCAPPLFEGVRSTDRLTLAEARRLAQRDVFKMYRVTGCDVTSGKPPMVIPGYGEVAKRQGIVLLDGMVEQIVPDPGDRDFMDENEDSLTVNFYEGYSKDKASAVFGSVDASIFQGTFYVGDNGAAEGNSEGVFDVNTQPDDRVPIGFSVDGTYNTITFSDYVFRTGPAGTNEEPNLVLQCAVHVRDPKTGQLVGYSEKRKIRNGDTVMVIKRPDVQLNVFGTYLYKSTTGWKLFTTDILESDPLTRARYYMDATMLQFQLKPGIVQKYNGIMPIKMDGRIMQVCYSIKVGSGCDTTVSLNGENDVWTPPYPARRRAENLASVDRVVPPGARNRMDDGPQFYAATNG